MCSSMNILQTEHIHIARSQRSGNRNSRPTPFSSLQGQPLSGLMTRRFILPVLEVHELLLSRLIYKQNQRRGDMA